MSRRTLSDGCDQGRFVKVPREAVVHLGCISTPDFVEMQRTSNNSNLVQRALGRWT
jgi:hypothetical protein